MTWTHLRHSQVRLAPGVFDDRRRLNREYLASLREAALLQNHFIEAGIGEQGWHLHPSGETPADRGLDRHWGWETPGSLLRGHFVGHWMSAAAREIAVTGDPHLRATLDVVEVGHLPRPAEQDVGQADHVVDGAVLLRLRAAPRGEGERRGPDLARGLAPGAERAATHDRPLPVRLDDPAPSLLTRHLVGAGGPEDLGDRRVRMPVGQHIAALEQAVEQ